MKMTIPIFGLQNSSYIRIVILNIMNFHGTSKQGLKQKSLIESLLLSSVKLFAGDCILYKAIHSPAPSDTVKLQEDLCALQDWQHT